MKKIVAMLLGMMMVLSLAGCGGSGGSAPKGEVQEYGNFSIFVPDGYVLTGGDVFDSENPDALTIQDEKDLFTYVLVTINDESSIDDGLDMTKEMNSDCEFKDCSLDLSNGKFTGFSYESSGIMCIQLKGAIGGKFVQVGSAGLKADDAKLKAILESITLK